MHYVQSFETARWCVDHEGFDIEQGQVVAFSTLDGAAHFVEQGRAGYIGEFAHPEHAFNRLADIVEAAKAEEEHRKEAAKAAAGSTGGDPNASSQGADGSDTSTGGENGGEMQSGDTQPAAAKTKRR